MNITKDQFMEIYDGLEVTKYIDLFYSSPKSDKDVVNNYLTSKLWRLNNVYSIVDKGGNLITFVMNLAQHKVFAASMRHSRIIILKSRQQGISTLWLVSYFDDIVTRPYFNCGLMAQGNDETATLLIKIKTLWNEMDPEYKKFLGIDLMKNNTKEFALTNSSTIFIRTSFRSTTLQRLHISEFGKIANATPKRARETKTGTLQAISPGNTAVIESTAEGENVFKNMWDTAMSFAGELTEKDFMPVFLSWVDDPDCSLSRDQVSSASREVYFTSIEEQLDIKLTKNQKNFWLAQYRELGRDIYQEYPATQEEAFLKNRDGTYYAAAYLRLIRGQKREVENLYDSNLDVQVAVDLGRNDDFVLVFFQTWTDGVRIINCYNDSGKAINHYCSVMDDLVDQYGYNITRVVLPHDATVRGLVSDKTREEAFWDCGYKDTYVVDRTPDINNDRQLVRQMMSRLWVDKRSQYIIDCFLNYSKEWDDKRSVWKELHDHNKYSHGMDAVRQLVRGAKKYYTPDTSRRTPRGIDV